MLGVRRKDRCLVVGSFAAGAARLVTLAAVGSALALVEG